MAEFSHTSDLRFEVMVAFEQANAQRYATCLAVGPPAIREPTRRDLAQWSAAGQSAEP
jgi:hypothetical protein